MKLDRVDGLCLGALLVFQVLYTALTFSFSAIPFEDAAILMRFADHMADGHGIIWNLGEKPVDGATDFLFLVSLGFLGMFGLDIHTAVQVVGIGSHAITALFLYWAIRWLHGAPRWMGLLSAVYLTIGPGLRQTEAYFGPTYFALFSATTFFLAYRVYLDRATTLTPILFALSSLVLGLIRPEGVFLSAFILFAVLWVRGWAHTRRLVLHYLVIFGGLGAAYFLWRWSYFGYPLPNPFYVKGGGSLYPFSLIDSCKNVIKLALPFLPILGYASAIGGARLLNSPQRAKYMTLFGGIAGVVWLCGLLTWAGGDPDKEDLARTQGVYWCAALGAMWLFGPLLLARAVPAMQAGPVSADPRRARDVDEPIFGLLPVFLFTFLWILLSAIMNYLERFQYAALPIVLLSWPAMWMGLRRGGYVPALAHNTGLRTAVMVAFFALSCFHPMRRYQSIHVQHDGTYEVAVMLAEYGDSDNMMIVTNAGHLPYYSRWSAIDAWGLSDQHIAHNGLDWDYVANANPDVIQFDGFFSPQAPDVDPLFAGWSWFEATRLLRRYAEENGYVLAAAWGLGKNKAHHYYVRSDWENADAVVDKIRNMEYRWFSDPKSGSLGPIAWDYRFPNPNEPERVIPGGEPSVLPGSSEGEGEGKGKGK